MAQEQWQRRISANSKPVSFGGGSDGIRRLELHACCLSSQGGSSAPVLYCALAGGPRLALARPTPASPYCQVRFTMDSDAGEAKLTCEGSGELLLMGVLTPLQDLEGLPPPAAKKPRVDIPASSASSSAARTSGEPAAPAPASGSPRSAAVAQPAGAAKAASAGKAAEKPASAEKAAEKAKAAAAKERLVTHRVLASGLRYEVLKVGSGAQAKLGKKVRVRYEGRLGTTGQRFDKGVIEFRLGMGEVIRGWDEGVKEMLQGERRRLLVPSKLGYGRSGAPPAIPPNSDLVFEVELLQC
eukprot:TRINITY_DN63567_c0_g1_i1.p1 TRINITY_DN63567_c0_g1~~TRINITY_DN63567_c0_g1_i1.p1  ORF type:complete len:298 (+),score=60.87 TRINITY_DN63567_c0_g1_i1:41-934(+)